MRHWCLIFLFGITGCRGDWFSISPAEVADDPGSDCSYGNKVLIATNAGINITDQDFSDFTQTLTTVEGLSSNTVYHLSNKDDIVYVSTHAGLDMFGGECNFTHLGTLTMADGLPANIVTKAEWSPAGQLWIHTTAGIAISTDDGATISSTITAATPGMTLTLDYGGDHSYSTYVGWGPVTGTLFMAGNGGVCRSTDGGANFACTTLNAISGSGNSNTVTGLAVLSNGEIILSTGFKFFSSIDDGVTWDDYGADRGLAHNWINGLNYYFNTTDRLFFSTAGLSGYSSDGALTLSNYGAGSGGAWNAWPMADGKVVMATVGAGMFVAASEATIGVTTPYTTADGLLNNRVRWVMDLE